MAPERMADGNVGPKVLKPSKESDIYSLAMMSFSVRTSFGMHTDIRYDHLVTIRSSQGYCHIEGEVRRMRSPIFAPVNDHPVRQTQTRVDGCGTLFGM